LRPIVSFDPRKFLAEGKKWSDRIAPLAFPILLAAAKSGRPISYKQLAEKLNQLHGEPVPKSFRNYGWPPGKVGDTLEELAKLWGEDIPPLSAIVTNGTSNLPGDGAFGCIDRYLKGANVTKGDKRACAQAALDFIFNYPRWDEVAAFFAIEVNKKYFIETNESPISLPDPRKYSAGYPESEAHKNLKEWVRDHPQFLKQPFGVFAPGVNEKTIQSGDRLDVFFSNSDMHLAVEVKAANAPDSECFRGIFQCVKYRAVLQATQLAEGKLPNAQAALVCQRSLPLEAVRLAKRVQVVFYTI
jgi:hypothetical protein